MPLPTLKQTVDALMMSKMNILHLHLSDSQSFPLELSTGHGPNISAAARYSANESYSPKDIAELHTYLLRGTCLDNHFHIFHVILGLNYTYILPGVGTQRRGASP